MSTLVVSGAVILLCTNGTIAKIIASTGILLNICGVKQGKTIAITSGVIYTVTLIVTSVI
jgi:hypothetical protein